ncbi:c-type cytochrome [Vulgatibacter incomptus]|uniref:Putative diheme cytochrome c-553 n=1 Tax=Vulgatibacter incomptus TaxID=1391653 RepID=A0A0K1PE30_9BACT|nr:cytochrome c [Vulgatibacter incomptus]AKU91681.1 Putative diheme cytochrome c-553 [Vulgatibacter incomptus]
MRRIAKWVGIAVLGLLLVASIGVGGAVLVAKRAMARVHQVPDEPLAIGSKPEVIEEGRRLLAARGCAECHGADLGGGVVLDDPALGSLYAPNITLGRGSVVEGFRDADWVRAIRHGVKRDGRPIVIMPANEYYFLSDRDLSAIIAFAKTAAPVDRELPPHRIKPLLYVLTALEVFPLLAANSIDHAAPREAVSEPEATKEYGRYLAKVQCQGCHGEGLGGGPPPGAPASLPVPANLTPDEATGIGKWTEADFVRALREGRRPDGRELDPFMPWKNFRNLDETELHALWAYVRSVPAKPFGSR